jgi:MYXO-CTERM domain-containing protein
MKNLNLTLSVAMIAAGTVSAYGQSFAYTQNSGDVILAVRDDAAKLNDVVIDLGPISAFQTGGAFADLTKNNLVTINGNSQLSVASALQGVYGSTLPSNLDVNLFATKRENNVPNTGITGTGSPKASSSIFVIAGRTGSNAGGSQGTESAYATQSKAANGATAGTINNIGGNAASSSSGNPLNSKTGFVSIDPTSTLSYTQTYNFGGVFQANYANTELTTVSGKSTIADFFYSPASVGTPYLTSAIYLGNFTLTSKGQLFYVPVGSSVPEPREYALVGGLGLVAFAAWRRRSSK